MELLACAHEAAAAALQQALAVALQVTERDHAAHIAAQLSLLRSRRGEDDEAERLASLASEQAPAEGVIAQALAHAAEGRVLAGHRDHKAAERWVHQAIEHLPDDMLPLRALLHETLAEVLELAGDATGTWAARDKAAALHAHKGNLAAARAVAP